MEDEGEIAIAQAAWIAMRSRLGAWRPRARMPVGGERRVVFMMGVERAARREVRRPDH